MDKMCQVCNLYDTGDEKIKADVDEPGIDRQELWTWSIQSWSGRDLRASVGWMTGFGFSSTVGDRTRC